MVTHQIVLLPIRTTIEVDVNLNPRQTFAQYIHHMSMYMKFDVHGNPLQFWTIPLPKGTKKCKQFIRTYLKRHSKENQLECKPTYIKHIATENNQHIYIILYTGYTAPDFHGPETSEKAENDPIWKWKNYIHLYSPWEKEVDSNGDIKMEWNSDGEEMTETTEKEVIPVYEYILEETKGNGNLFEYQFPIEQISSKHIKMHDICEALTNIEIKSSTLKVPEICEAMKNIQINVN